MSATNSLTSPPVPPGTCFWCDTPGQFALRKRTKRDRSVSVEWQCRVCGHGVAQPVARKTVPDWEQLPEWDEAASRAYSASRETLSLQTAADKKAAERAEYHAYLQTETWRAKSRKVLHRDRTCQACGEAASEQAHHLTYERIYREPLFDLVGVCRPCHESLHRHEAPEDPVQGGETEDELLRFG